MVKKCFVQIVSRCRVKFRLRPVGLSPLPFRRSYRTTNGQSHDIVRHQLPPQSGHPLPSSSSRRHNLQPVSSYMSELHSSGNDVNPTASRSTNAASGVIASDATVKIEPVTVTNPVGPSVTLKPKSTTPSSSSILSALSTIIDLTEDSGDDQELPNAASMAGRQQTDARCRLSLALKLEHEDEAGLPDSTAGNSTTTDISLPFMDAVSILRTLQPDQEEVVSPTAGGVSGANLKRKDGPSIGSENDSSDQDTTQVKPETEGVKRKKIEQSPRILVASRNKQTVSLSLSMHGWANDSDYSNPPASS